MSYSQNSIKLGRIDDILFKKIDLMFRKNTRKVLNWSISFGKTAKVSLIRPSSLGKVDFQQFEIQEQKHVISNIFCEVFQIYLNLEPLKYLINSNHRRSNFLIEIQVEFCHSTIRNHIIQDITKQSQRYQQNNYFKISQSLLNSCWDVKKNSSQLQSKRRRGQRMERSVNKCTPCKCNQVFKYICCEKNSRE